jgi:hypothetical protein
VSFLLTSCQAERESEEAMRPRMPHVLMDGIKGFASHVQFPRL